jgi:NTE family protein
MSKVIGRIFFIILLFSVLCGNNSYCRENNLRPKIGLALSGGGAKGLAHIGVLKVLEEVGVPIDYIAGTSMGSIVGALYAIGYQADEMKKLALTTDWANLLTDEVSRRYVAMEEKIWDARYMGSFPISKKGVQLPSGLIAGQKISNFLSRLTWSVHHINDFSQLPIPFTCVATDVATGEAVAIDSGFLPDAIRASMAIPTVFTPIKLQDRLLVDGGLVRNLPAEDVKRMGADIIIGVDVSFTLLPLEDINSFLDIITQSLSFVEAQSREKQHKLCNVLIQPDITGLTMFSFNEVEEIINRGEIAARQVLPRLRALMDSLALTSESQVEFIPPQVDSIYIKSLKIWGLRDVSRRLVLAELNIKSPSWISAKDLEDAIDRVYSSQFFERVTYKLIPSDRGSDLIVRVIEKGTDLFRFGLRYDSYFKTALIFNTTFRNLAEHGSNLVLDLKLGEQSQLDVQYFIHTGLRQRFGLHARTNYTSQIIDIYEDEKREASMRARSATGEILLGTIFSTKAITGIGLRGEFVQIKPRIGPEDLRTEEFKFLSLYGLIWMDTFNHAVFPSNGQSLRVSGIVADKRIASNITFTQYHFDWQSAYPLHSKLSLVSRLEIGIATGSKIPLNYRFYLGGADSFLGLKYQEYSGKYLQALQLGLQYEIFSKRFIQLRWNMGNTSDQWKNPFIRNHAVTGFGLTAGIATPIGPIELTLMSGSRHRFLAYFNLGYKF